MKSRMRIRHYCITSPQSTCRHPALPLLQSLVVLPHSVTALFVLPHVKRVSNVIAGVVVLLHRLIRLILPWSLLLPPVPFKLGDQESAGIEDVEAVLLPKRLNRVDASGD